MNTHSAVVLYVSIIAASPLLAIWYAIMAIVVISVETLKMEKNAVFQAGETLQMDSRPAASPSALVSTMFGRPQWAQISVSQLSMFGRSSPLFGFGGCKASADGGDGRLLLAPMRTSRTRPSSALPAPGMGCRRRSGRRLG